MPIYSVVHKPIYSVVHMEHVHAVLQQYRLQSKLRRIRIPIIYDSKTNRFLDTHKIGSFTEEQLMDSQKSPRDEFGVTVINILYNYEADIMYCILHAPKTLLKCITQNWAITVIR